MDKTSVIIFKITPTIIIHYIQPHLPILKHLLILPLLLVVFINPFSPSPFNNRLFLTNKVDGGRFNISKNTMTVNTDIEKLIKAEVFKK